MGRNSLSKALRFAVGGVLLVRAVLIVAFWRFEAVAESSQSFEGIVYYKIPISLCTKMMVVENFWAAAKEASNDMWQTAQSGRKDRNPRQSQNQAVPGFHLRFL